MKELLVVKHRSCRYMLFRLLVDPMVEAELLATCASSRDMYTRSCMETYASDLSSQEALLELAMVVMNAKTSTVHLKCSNATLRRRFVLASTKVVTPELHSISAEFMLGKLRRRTYEAKVPPGHRSHREKTTAQNMETPRKRRGGGGAWRAFLRKKGKNVADPNLSLEYRALSDAEKAELMDAGSLAAKAHKYGLPSFGPKRRAEGLVGRS